MLLTLLVALALGPRGCVHGLAEPRPRVTVDGQAHTEAVLAHVVHQLGASQDFHRFLHLVATRESSLQQGLIHRLPDDLVAAASAYRRTHVLYTNNAFRADPRLWQTYGLFGMNSNYFVQVWDPSAHPRVLCDAVVDVLVYRRAAVRALRRAGQTVTCQDEHGQPFYFTIPPTWAAIHRIVSGGKVCPSEGLDARFARRARRAGLDPDQRVTLAMLGAEPEAATQCELVAALWTTFTRQ